MRFVNFWQVVKFRRNVVSLVSFHHNPGGRARGIKDQAELFVGRFDAYMLDVAARQTTAANETIAGRARPTYFHQQLPHAAAQTQEAADHARIADIKTMCGL